MGLESGCQGDIPSSCSQGGERGKEAGKGGLWWRGNLAAPQRAGVLMQLKFLLLSVVFIFIIWR